MNDKKIPVQLPSRITLNDKKCKYCDSQNIFMWNQSNDDVIPVCPKCKNIRLINSEEEVQRIDKRIKILEKEFRLKTKLFNQKTLLNFIHQTQNLVGRERYDYTVPFGMILTITEFTEKAWKFSDPNGKIHNKKEFLNCWDLFCKIDGFRFLRQNLYFKIVFIDTNNVQYFTYTYIRRMDGMGEFGVGRRSQLKKLFEEYEDVYKKEFLKELESKEGKNIFSFFKDDDPETLEFFSSFYCAIQSDKEKINRLNMSWITKYNIRIERLQQWRKEFFSSYRQNSAKETLDSLISFFGEENASSIYQNLISSIYHPNILPYGIEIEGMVNIAPEWAQLLEILFITEREGEKRFQILQNIHSKIFEKNIIPNIFGEMNFKISPGHKQIKKGEIKFEIDSFILDDKGTLWIVEIKSKKLYKRFMESYDSWDEECKSFVERPKRKCSYPEIIEEINRNYPLYQQKNILPNNWVINDIQGLIIMNLPPFEEIYNGIHLIWYREIVDFFIKL